MSFEISQLLKEAERGAPSAQYELAERYYNGDGVAQDVYRAIHWYAYAAEGGVDSAVRMFDRLYYFGSNVGFKMMGFWFERECITHERIPPSTPYELSPIKYSDGDNTQKQIKAMLPWSMALVTDFKIDTRQCREIKNRKLFIAQVGEGHTFDSSRKSGLLTGTKLSGAIGADDDNTPDMALPKDVVDVAIKQNLIERAGDLNMQIVELHKRFGEEMFRVCQVRLCCADDVRNLIRFAFMKGMEQRVCCDVYSNTRRHSSYDFYMLPEDCFLPDGCPAVITELPHHLNDTILSFAESANSYATAVVQCNVCPSDESRFKNVLVSACLIGDYVAAKNRIAEMKIKNYDNANMLTMEELRTVAGGVLLRQCEAEGGKILTSRFARSCNTNAVVQYANETRAYLLRATQYPNTIGFFQYELDRLYEGAMSHNCVPYVVTAAVASTDNAHFNDGVVMVDDGHKVMFTGYQKLEIEDA